MLSKQTSTIHLGNPFSAARGQQLQWLQSEDYAKGMPEGLRATYMNNLQTSIDDWTATLEKAQQQARPTLSTRKAAF